LHFVFFLYLFLFSLFTLCFLFLSLSLYIEERYTHCWKIEFTHMTRFSLILYHPVSITLLFCLSVSLSLSHTHTHTHEQTHSLTYALSVRHTGAFTHTFFLPQASVACCRTPFVSFSSIAWPPPSQIFSPPPSFLSATTFLGRLCGASPPRFARGNGRSVRVLLSCGYVCMYACMCVCACVCVWSV
jgi:hypothetical protein